MVGFTKEARSSATLAKKVLFEEKIKANLAQYDLAPTKCRNGSCDKNLSYMQFKGGNKFCCRSCANSIAKITKESKNKMKETFRLKNPERNKHICIVCDKEFICDSRKICCSKECKFERRKVAAQKANETAKKNNSRRGWSKRTFEPSYPEKYFISLFENEKITGWVREKKVNKWFIDFAFVEKMIAVEIDGAQHEFEDRKISDGIKDSYLIDSGWKIIRIKWFNPITEQNRNKLYPQIENLKKILKN